MEHKTEIQLNNISDGVEFLLRGAKKRRTMAINSVREVNSEIGVNLKLIAVK